MIMADAKFEDGAEQALSLKAETAEDLAVISALVQDAVLPATEMRWDRKGRTLSAFSQPLPLGRSRHGRKERASL
jgi:hypothetical protein